MTIQEINIKHGIWVNGIGTRIFLYFLGYSFLAFAASFGIFFAKQQVKITGDYTIDNIIVFSALFLPFVILELLVRNYRKNENFSIYSNVAKEIQEKYYSNSNNFLDQKEKDLNYWFELKEKGAITQNEYELKKKELLN